MKFVVAVALFVSFLGRGETLAADMSRSLPSIWFFIFVCRNSTVQRVQIVLDHGFNQLIPLPFAHSSGEALAFDYH